MKKIFLILMFLFTGLLAGKITIATNDSDFFEIIFQNEKAWQR